MGVSGNPQLSTSQPLALSVSPPALQLLDSTSIRTSTVAFIAAAHGSAAIANSESSLSYLRMDNVDDIYNRFGQIIDYKSANGQPLEQYKAEVMRMLSVSAPSGTVAFTKSMIHAVTGVTPEIVDSGFIDTGLVILPLLPDAADSSSVLMSPGPVLFSRRHAASIFSIRFDKIVIDTLDTMHANNALWGLYTYHDSYISIGRGAMGWYAKVVVANSTPVELAISADGAIFVDTDMAVLGTRSGLRYTDPVIVSPSVDGTYIARFFSDNSTVTVTATSNGMPYDAASIFIGKSGSSPTSNVINLQAENNVTLMPDSFLEFISARVPAHMRMLIYDIDGNQVDLNNLFGVIKITGSIPVVFNAGTTSASILAEFDVA